jgi:cytoskeletal protein RodZ
MELFGEKLKTARESKNYTIEQVARDTRISTKYIRALEGEDFAAFPGETYLIGFLKSYTEFLGLDSDKYINLYKNYRIQEQEIPIHELLDKKKKMPPLIIASIPIGGIAVIGCIVLILFLTVFGQQSGTPKEQVTIQENLTASKETFDFKDEVITRWFKSGDAIKFAMSDIEYKIEIANDSEDLVLKTDTATKKLKLSQASYFDFNSDGKADMRIVYNDLKKDDVSPQVNLGLYKITVSMPAYVTEGNAGEQQDTSKGASDDSSKQTSAEEAIKVKEDTKTVILQADKPSVFTINITFRGYCLLRWFIDNKTRDQRFFLKKEIQPLEVKNSVKLWISNANSVSAMISGKEIIMGKAGQVVTKLIHWVKDAASGKYQLEIVSVY